jgi:outer membrane lipoprotein-sorting protein
VENKCTLQSTVGVHANNQAGQSRPKGQRSITSAWVYALTPGDAKTSNEVVTGILSISHGKALVIFDSGATHSFVSYSIGIGVNTIQYNLAVVAQ